MDETEKRKFKINSIECRKEEKLPPWSELPCPVLEKLFSFLNHKDRYQMSLVCYKWLEESKSPSLWRRMRFCFQEARSSYDESEEIKLVKKYGRMFRHVDIYCGHVDDGVKRNGGTFRQLSLLLQELCSNSLLLTIKFKVLEKGGWPYNGDADYNFFLLCVKDLLKAQVQLKSLEFTGTLFEIENGIDILDAAFTNNAGNMKRLALRGFVDFTYKRGIFKMPFIHLMKSLESFETDYNHIFECTIYELLLHSTAGNKGSSCRLCEIKLNIDLLTIVVDREYEDYELYRGISSSVWKQLREIFPELNVSLYIYSPLSYLDDIEFFFKPGMPVKSLTIELYDDYAYFYEYLLGYFLTARINECLEYLSTVCRDSMAYLQPMLTEFLLACQKLENFHIAIKHPATGLEGLFRAWVTERPASLKAVTVTISNIQTEDVSSFKNMAEFYINLLSDTGLLLCFNTDFD